MPGPAPKKAIMRERRNKDVTAATLLDARPLKGIPELPKRRRKWGVETIAWWKDIWRSPMAPEFIQSDIHQLYILADLTDQYWRESATKRGPSPALATEIRLQRQCFGMTPIDRRRLQWSVEKAEGASAKGQKRRNDRYRFKKYKKDPREALESVN